MSAPRAGLRAPTDPTLRRPGHVAAVRELPHRGRSSTTARPSTRSTCGSAPSACSCSCPLTSRPRTSSATTRTSPRISDSWVATPRGSSSRPSTGSAWARRLRRRGGEQRRLPAAARPVAAASGAWASNPRPTSPRRPSPRASRPSSSSSARRPGRGSPRTTAARTSSSPTTCSRTCPTSSTSPTVCARLVADDGRRHHRDPAPAAPDRGPAVRHHLPRAFLLPVAAHHPAGARHGRADRHRRRGTGVPTAVRCGHGRCPQSRHRRRRSGSPGSWPTRRDAGLDTLRGPLGVRRRGRRGPQRHHRVPHRPVSGRGHGGRLRCPGQGEHPAQPLPASGRTCSRSRSTAAPSSTGSSCREPTSRSTTRTGSPWSDPTTSSSSPGTCRREIAEQLEYTRAWGAKLVVPLPRLEVF